MCHYGPGYPLDGYPQSLSDGSWNRLLIPVAGKDIVYDDRLQNWRQRFRRSHGSVLPFQSISGEHFGEMPGEPDWKIRSLRCQMLIDIHNVAQGIELPRRYKPCLQAHPQRLITSE